MDRDANTPQEIIATFWFLWNEGKNSEAMEYYGVDGLMNVIPQDFETTRIPWEIKFVEVNKDVSKESNIVSYGSFLDPTEVLGRGSRTIEELQSLTQEGALFKDVDPYELGGLIYTREVIKERMPVSRN